MKNTQTDYQIINTTLGNKLSVIRKQLGNPQEVLTEKKKMSYIYKSVNKQILFLFEGGIVSEIKILYSFSSEALCKITNEQLVRIFILEGFTFSKPVNGEGYLKKGSLIIKIKIGRDKMNYIIILSVKK